MSATLLPDHGLGRLEQGIDSGSEDPLYGRRNETASLPQERTTLMLQGQADLRQHDELPPSGSKSILVACHEVVLTGGLLRFDNIAAVLHRWGHSLSFVTLAENPREHRPSDVSILSLEQAFQTRWDVVMVPGAGFPEETIARFAAFRDERFGVRVQHILNDQQQRVAFKAVNDSFAPQVLIFNNDYWPPGSVIGFSGERFHVLLGAVDPVRFRPDAHRGREIGRWVVGGQTRKNPSALIDALKFLGPEVSIRLYGPDTQGLAERYVDLVKSGRLQLEGPLFGRDLTRFYHQVDCIVSAETMAGWANLSAEAMASGVPVICTSNGTRAFAYHEESALLLDSISPVDIAASIRRLQADPLLCDNLSGRGREIIERYSWEAYTKGLLSIIDPDDHGGP